MKIEKNSPIVSITEVVVLVSFSMLFATLFLLTTLYRNSSNWISFSSGLPLFWPTVSLLVMILSEISLWRFQKNFGQKWLLGGAVLGLLFLGGQIKLLGQLNDLGIYASTSVWASLIHAFTWIHGGHVILGLIALWLILWPKFFQRHVVFSQLAIKFWHFLGIVWFMIYLTIFYNLSMKRKIFLMIGTLLLLSCKKEVFRESIIVAGGEVISANTLRQGQDIYQEYCMACHGEKGDGKGVASKGMKTPPRDFTTGLIKFGDTLSGEFAP